MRSPFQAKQHSPATPLSGCHNPEGSSSWYVLAEKDQAVRAESRGGLINYSEVGSGDGSRLGARLVRTGQVGVARAGSSASIHRDCGPVLSPRH